MPKYKQRIVVKLRDRLVPTAGLIAAATKQLNSFLEPTFPNVYITGMFSSPDALAKLLTRTVKFNPDYRAPNFFSYFIIGLPDSVTENEKAKMELKLTAWSETELVYVDPSGKNPQGVNPWDDQYFNNQRYLYGPSEGINAINAWPITGSGFRGADGVGVRFLDIERAWKPWDRSMNLPPFRLEGGEMSGVLNEEVHGNAVLHIVAAKDNQRRWVGVAPNVNSITTVSYLNADVENRAGAITRAASLLSPGDVLLIEIQLTEPGHPPIEVAPADFNAIRLAVEAGIVVIEPAGNGSKNLNFPQLDPNDIAFQDSGAIVVGASTSALARSDSSNYGRRVNCFTPGPGKGVGPTPNIIEGTSAASAIIAGAAASVQGFARALGRVLMPRELRDLLSDTSGVNTFSQNPAADQIGVMPNLAGIMSRRISKPNSTPAFLLGDSSTPNKGEQMDDNNEALETLVEEILDQCIYALGCGARMSIKRTLIQELKDHVREPFTRQLGKDLSTLSGPGPGEAQWSQVRGFILDCCLAIGRLAAQRATARGSIVIQKQDLQPAYNTVSTLYQPLPGDYCPDWGPQT